MSKVESKPQPPVLLHDSAGRCQSCAQRPMERSGLSIAKTDQGQSNLSVWSKVTLWARADFYSCSLGLSAGEEIMRVLAIAHAQLVMDLKRPLAFALSQYSIRVRLQRGCRNECLSAVPDTQLAFISQVFCEYLISQYTHWWHHEDARPLLRSWNFHSISKITRETLKKTNAVFIYSPDTWKTSTMCKILS